MIQFDLGELIDEDLLTHLEQQAIHDPPVIALRIRLSRALNDGVDALREAISILDACHHVADAARAAALLALRTKKVADRVDAERRLNALEDRAYLQRLAEEW